MIKYVPARSIEDDDSFLYNLPFYPTQYLRSVLYSMWWETKTADDGTELVIVMDFDGFIEWYDSHVDEWMEDEENLPEDRRIDWSDYPADEYLRDHLGKTVDVVREVKA